MKKEIKPCILSYKYKQNKIVMRLKDNELDISGVFEVNHTYHSLKRSQKRGINEKMISNLLCYGSIYEKQGLQYFVLGDKEIKKEGLEISLNSSLVAVLKNDVILTTYYTNKISGYRHVQKKSKEYYKNYNERNN